VVPKPVQPWYTLLMSSPLVSICMPAYNTGLYIEEAIQSCIEQTYNKWELIIWDDGSTDNTMEVIKSFNDYRIIVGSSGHKGVANARNRCLDLCCGEIIARMDSDDYQDPTRIEKSVNMLLKNPEPLVTCRMLRFKGEKWKNSPKVRNHNDFGNPDCSGKMNPSLYWGGSNKGNPVNASIVAMKEVYDRVGGFNEEMETAEDGDWNFRALKHYDNWQFIDEYLYIYRRHPSQLTQRKRNETWHAHRKSMAIHLKTRDEVPQ